MAKLEPAYIYTARLDHLIDADTVRLTIDIGFHITVTETFRLYGINAPENSTLPGKNATAFARNWWASRDTVTVRTYKVQEKYGRWLAYIYGGDGVALNDWLVANGHAIPYLPGGTTP